MPKRKTPKKKSDRAIVGTARKKGMGEVNGRRRNKYHWDWTPSSGRAKSYPGKTTKKKRVNLK